VGLFLVEQRGGKSKHFEGDLEKIGQTSTRETQQIRSAVLYLRNFSAVSQSITVKDGNYNIVGRIDDNIIKDGKYLLG